MFYTLCLIVYHLTCRMSVRYKQKVQEKSAKVTESFNVEALFVVPYISQLGKCEASGHCHS
jgi:hypothetical protein